MATIRMPSGGALADRRARHRGASAACRDVDVADPAQPAATRATDMIAGVMTGSVSRESRHPGAIPDHRALRECWHPVGFAKELSDQPRRVVVLGEPVVLWRDGAGAVRALRDICIHRGTALSLGRIDGDQLICPYHGWRYAADGRCVAIPQLADPSRVPGKARVSAHRCQERYGLIWVALDEPRWPLPEIPELEDDDGWQAVPCGPFVWRSDASRQVENFTDFGHFPWVHPGLLGDPERPVVPSHRVDIDGHVLRYEIVRPEAPSSDDFPVFANIQTDAPERRSRYELHLPYTIVLRLGWGGERGMIYFFASQPIDHSECAGYLVIGRNYDHDQPGALLQRFEDTIFEQDRRMVESQQPERVPFDLADEMHLKFDAVAVAYRRAMRRQGLADTAPAPGHGEAPPGALTSGDPPGTAPQRPSQTAAVRPGDPHQPLAEVRRDQRRERLGS
jgi:phenylpropionate dioxygenase-like ring-hydroxylating dioxygenase large terminal subunit